MRLITLEEVCEIIMGQSPPGSSYNNNRIGKALIAGPGDFDSEKVNCNKFTTKPTKICEKNDIIIGIRGSIGQKIWADKTYCLGRGVAAIRPNKSLIDPSFLWHLLTTKEDFLISKAVGATIKGISKKDLNTISFYLPPIKEQLKIGLTLNKTESIIRNSNKFCQLIDELITSYFSQKINLISPETKCLGEIVDFQGGGTPRKDIKKYWDGNIPWASVKDFISNELKNTKEYISESGLKNSSSTLVPIGTLIIPTRMALGKTSINSIKVAINQDLKALIPKLKFNTHFLMYALQFKKGEIISLGRGATVKGITIDVLKNIKIPFPSIKEQTQIATSIQSLINLKEIPKKIKKKTKELKGSIMKDSFSKTKMKC